MKALTVQEKAAKHSRQNEGIRRSGVPAQGTIGQAPYPNGRAPLARSAYSIGGKHGDRRVVAAVKSAANLVKWCVACICPQSDVVAVGHRWSRAIAIALNY